MLEISLILYKIEIEYLWLICWFLTAIRRSNYRIIKINSFIYSCKQCFIFVYCGVSCRDNDWSESHQYECAGIRSGFLIDFQSLLLPLRMFLKGLPSKFRNLSENEKKDVKRFGSESDNYSYVNELRTNFNRSPLHSPHISVYHLWFFVMK